MVGGYLVLGVVASISQSWESEICFENFFACGLTEREGPESSSLAPRPNYSLAATAVASLSFLGVLALLCQSSREPAPWRLGRLRNHW